MLLRPVCLAALALLPACAPPAAACTPKVRAEVLRRALKLMPPALARQLTRHERELKDGALRGTDLVPVQALEPGTHDADLAALVASAKQLLDSQAPMSEVARTFGAIARASFDLSFALNVGPHDERDAAIYGPFCTYVEQKLPRIATTFSGYENDELARGDVAAFARQTARIARRDYPGILNSYFPPGRKALPQDFDDRSVAFASASLEVSLALTTTARSWLYAWNEAQGDLTGTPFLDGDRR